MKSKIEGVISRLNAELDYTLNNSDYTSNFDVLLVDDSAYHSSQWQAAIEASQPGREISDYALEKIIETILWNVTGYCEVSVKNPGFPYPADDLTIASFPIGELEVQIDEPLTPGQIQYIERETDWTYHGGCFYYSMCYAVVEYTIKPAEIDELFRSIAHDEWESNAELLLSDSRGIYIPRDFLDFDKFRSQLSDEEIETLSNPENEWYWETWGSVLNREFLIDGTEYRLHQDGDLFAYKASMDSCAWECMQ